jgi:hypothetical protein
MFLERVSIPNTHAHKGTLKYENKHPHPFPPLLEEEGEGGGGVEDVGIIFQAGTLISIYILQKFWIS